MYRFNIAQDLQPEDIQPWAEALFLQRVRESRKDSPLAKCMPVSVPYHQFFNLTRLVQTPTLMVILHESPNSPHRTVFTDGRDLPKDPNPTYMGYSVGQVGRRHAGRDDGRVQRQGLARQRRPSADRVAARDRTLPATRLRSHGFRNHHRRSEGVQQAVHDQDAAARCRPTPSCSRTCARTSDPVLGSWWIPASR